MSSILIMCASILSVVGLVLGCQQNWQTSSIVWNGVACLLWLIIMLALFDKIKL